MRSHLAKEDQYLTKWDLDLRYPTEVRGPPASAKTEPRANAYLFQPLGWAGLPPPPLAGGREPWARAHNVQPQRRPCFGYTSAGNCWYRRLQDPPRRRALELRAPVVLFSWATAPSKAQGPQDTSRGGPSYETAKQSPHPIVE